MLKNRNRLALKVAVAAASVLCFVGASFALTTTSTFTTQIMGTAACTISSASTLDFGATGVLVANVDRTSTVQVTCTDSTPYDIGLDAGTGTGATVAVRKLSSGDATVSYTLYSDTSRTTVWGNTIGTDTVAAAGNGSAQNYTVYGRVPPQTTPAAGTYNDTVTVTVTY
jgi:spore coat protein U-like protein